MKVDMIYCADSRHMRDVDDASVQLIVTSPPYNVGKAYEGYRDRREFKQYERLLLAVWKECIRVLCPGGRIAVNVANTNRTPYVPLNSIITDQLTDLGLLMRGEVIWNKGPSVGVSTAWGSFAAATNPVLRDVHEYIMIFSKGSYAIARNGNGSGIENIDFVKWTQSVWDFPTESARRVGHPAPFPIELPRRLILLYSHIGDTVLDPFMGSGTTAVAAKEQDRHFIGYDVSRTYCTQARGRVRAMSVQSLPARRPKVPPSMAQMTRPRSRSKDGQGSARR
ncbi:MAG: site-specific DNA-methyltransferase [Actinobacteria bacterium]|nr:site-specific DNA-methyltransferase [Actinomycetota bacterium]